MIHGLENPKKILYSTYKSESIRKISEFCMVTNFLNYKLAVDEKWLSLNQIS
jgi:hypothetical protein